MIAHAAGGGAVFNDITGLGLPNWLAVVLYTVVFAPIVYLGAHSVDRLNLVLISGVVLCYLTFVAVSYSYVDTKLLSYANWGKAWYALPILFTAFTYQVIIPTLMTYMKRDVKKIRLAIVLGSFIPFVIYLIWQVVILGIVPAEGPDGLIEAGLAGHNAVGPLKQFLQNPLIFVIGKYFAFFALTTSFIPLALSFFDFLADGFKWKKVGFHRVALTAIVFGIPMIIALLYPNIFLIALGYAGGFSCAFLFGLMPPVLAWVGRYKMHYPKDTRQLGGGKPFLAFLMFFAICILIAEVVQQAL
jgi:tyrosine-specific transport protein